MLDAVEMARSIIERLDSKKQGMFEVNQDNVVHMLPSQIMTDTSG